MINIVHVTHEAVHKMGGIGTVLEGLINSRPYRDRVGRTVLVCPLFETDLPERLGPAGKIEYSSLDHIQNGPYAESFRRIEQDYQVHLVYGRRPIEDEVGKRRTVCEVLLVDVRHVRGERLNEVKAKLWEHHGLQSHRHEHVWDFEQYIRLAGPASAAIEAMRLATNEQPAAVFAHEFMGIPTALMLVDQSPRRYRTVFHAHEVATIRRIVEEHPGHDRMFYNVLRLAERDRLYLNDVFGSQHDYFKHALVETTRDFDAVLAVGHHVAREIRFLGREFQQAEVTVAYNGIPAERTTQEERRASKELLGDYCEALMGWRPDLFFSHVTRFVVSKALWRDLDVLEALDAKLVERNQRAVFIVLSTELARRPVSEVLRMEREWDWPLVHREGYPDLSPNESRFYHKLSLFNARARNIRAVFVNQFGLEHPGAGQRVPAEMNVTQFRRATDVEFGLALYEPFGISPLEPLTFGGLCVISTSCGCAGFVRSVLGKGESRNVILADYIGEGPAIRTIGEAAKVDEAGRRAVERDVAVRLAEQIAERLPRDAEQERALSESGYELASKMSWDVVSGEHVFPTLDEACARRRILSIAS